MANLLNLIVGNKRSFTEKEEKEMKDRMEFINKLTSNEILIDEEITKTPLKKLHDENTFNQNDIEKDKIFFMDLNALKAKLDMAYDLREHTGRLLNKDPDDVTLEDVANAIKLADDILHAIDW